MISLNVSSYLYDSSLVELAQQYGEVGYVDTEFAAFEVEFHYAEFIEFVEALLYAYDVVDVNVSLQRKHMNFFNAAGSNGTGTIFIENL